MAWARSRTLVVGEYVVVSCFKLLPASVSLLLM